MITEFLREITHEGYRIFSINDAKNIAKNIGIKSTSVSHILNNLKTQKLIRPLWRGHYAIEDNILAGSPLGKFEIGMHLAMEGAISCWSALSHYGLTDQVLSKVYLFLPYDSYPKRCITTYSIDGYDYLLIQIQSKHFWGIKTEKVGGEKIRITDLERTLLDGLTRPHYCGGFREVINAFLIASDRINLEQLLIYAQKCPISIQKRLGWMLEYINFGHYASRLALPKTNYIDKLDIASPRRGTYNKTWMIVENY